MSVPTCTHGKVGACIECFSGELRRTGKDRIVITYTDEMFEANIRADERAKVEAEIAAWFRGIANEPQRRGLLPGNVNVNVVEAADAIERGAHRQQKEVTRE